MRIGAGFVLKWRRRYKRGAGLQVRPAGAARRFNFAQDEPPRAFLLAAQNSQFSIFNSQFKKLNHLAHFHLSLSDADLMLGNWAADSVKGRAWEAFPPGIQRGILLHRAIDHFTDSHPATRVLNAQLRPFAGRFAGPVGDVLRDHFLSVRWAKFSKTPLAEFAEGVYKVLISRNLELPPGLRERTPRMVSANWLLSYGTLDGLILVLERLQKRFPAHPLDLAALRWFLGEEMGGLLAEFEGFYPEIFAHAEAWVLAKVESQH